MKAIITVGVSGSGKSTWAEKFKLDNSEDNWQIVERDKIRREQFDFEQWSEYKFTRAKEEKVSKIQRQYLANDSSWGHNVIVSDTNLNPKYRKELEEYLVWLGYEVEIKEFPISWDEAVKRNGNREYSVSLDVLYRQYQQWLEYSGRKTYTPNEDLPKAIIFDVDGTLAEMDGRQPFDWHRVGEDKPRTVVIDMLLGYQDRSYSIIVLSGRDGVCKPQTQKWLQDYGIVYDEFHMRAEGDMRKDTVIKEEIFWTYLANEYNIQAVVDDRPCVCRMWRELGLPVWMVSEPLLEF